MEQGKNVILLSISGLGRAPMMAAACLLSFGKQQMTPAEVIELVRQVRSQRAIESKKQAEFIELFAQQISQKK